MLIEVFQNIQAPIENPEITKAKNNLLYFILLFIWLFFVIISKISLYNMTNTILTVQNMCARLDINYIW